MLQQEIELEHEFGGYVFRFMTTYNAEPLYTAGRSETVLCTIRGVISLPNGKVCDAIMPIWKSELTDTTNLLNNAAYMNAIRQVMMACMRRVIRYVREGEPDSNFKETFYAG